MRFFGWTRQLGGTAAGLVLALALLLGTATDAVAGDKIYLKDGRVIEGQIVRELSGSVWIDYSIGGVSQSGAFFAASAIERIERDADSAPAGSDPVRAAAEDSQKLPPKRSGVPRGVVITLEGMVGVQFAAQPLHNSIEWLEDNEIDIVVFKVNSGGGYLLEIPKMHEVIQDEFKPRFRTVAWIESAISAAAMSSHILEEIYFMRDGNYGACTGWSGALVAVEGLELEKVLYMMERVSAQGKRAPEIMRSMQIEDPLSYNRNQDGQITWYNTDEGEYMVNPAGRILTFDSAQAAECKFSKGTTNDLNTLTKMLGYNEIEWVGKQVSGEIFPISQPEADMRAWREGVTKAEERMGSYFQKYQLAVQNAAGTADLKERGSFVGLARRHLAVIRSVAKTYPTLAYVNGLSDDWFREQERMLRDLLRP